MKERIYGGQSYHLTGERPYTRRDGTQTTLSVWSSKCATCGEPFEIVTPSQSSKFEPNRRCQKHKRPGSKVRHEQARKERA